MELDLGDQEFCVLFNTRTIAILQVAPELAHLRKHRSVSHRVLAAQVVPLTEHLMEEMAELPGRDAILQEGLSDRDCPEGMRSLAMKGADDGCPGMFNFQRGLLRTQRFTDADRLGRRWGNKLIISLFLTVLENKNKFLIEEMAKGAYQLIISLIIHCHFGYRWCIVVV